VDPEASTVVQPVATRPITLRVSGWSLVRAVLIVGAGLVALGVFLAASTLLWWLAIATAVAGAFYPAVTWLRRWMPAWAAIMVVIILAVAFVGLVGYQGTVELSAQFEIMRNNALTAAREIQSSPQFGQVAGEFGLVDKATRFFQNLPPPLGTGGDPAATVQTAASSGSALFAIATFAVLILIFGPRFVRAGLMQVDDLSVRHRLGRLVRNAFGAASRYVWLMGGRAVLLGVIAGLTAAALRLDTPTAAGVAFAALSIIPGLGIVLAAIPVAIYLAVTSPVTAIVVICGAIALQAVEASTVQKRINDLSVQVGPTATLVAALLGLQLYGFGGVLVGLGVAVYGLALLRHLTDSHDEVLTAMRRLVREGEETSEVIETALDEAPPEGDGASSP
jgi:predicted PurR-regulated permease PerM